MYQIIIKPIIANTIPIVRKLFNGIASINLDIFLIFDGNKAQRRPSINKTKPMAIMNSFKPKPYCFLITPVFPKNLKKSLSGDKINDVSPPISAFSYDCIAL